MKDITDEHSTDIIIELEIIFLGGLLLNLSKKEDELIIRANSTD